MMLLLLSANYMLHLVLYCCFTEQSYKVLLLFCRSHYLQPWEVCNFPKTTQLICCRNQDLNLRFSASKTSLAYDFSVYRMLACIISFKPQNLLVYTVTRFYRWKNWERLSDFFMTRSGKMIGLALRSRFSFWPHCACATKCGWISFFTTRMLSSALSISFSKSNLSIKDLREKKM